MPTEDDLPLIS